jgi:hypothetical protein
VAGQQGHEEVDARAGEFALAADLVRDAAGEFVPQQLGVEAVAVPAVLLETADGVPEPGRGDLVVGDVLSGRSPSAAINSPRIAAPFSRSGDPTACREGGAILTVEAVRPIRDAIEERLRGLLSEILPG